MWLTHTGWSMISNVSGSISFFSSFVSLFPQIIETYHDKTVDGISPYFLLCWLCGDITSLIGALLTRQLRFQILLAIYFLCNDMFVCGQYYYYGVLHGNEMATMGHEAVPVLSRVNTVEEMERVIEESNNDSIYYDGDISQSNDVMPRSNSLRSNNSSRKALSISLALAATLERGSAMFASMDMDTGTTVDIAMRPPQVTPPFPSPGNGHHRITFTADIGLILSWMGALFYVGARIPQLIKNYRRKSTDGLSPFLFATTLLGNITYNLSIFTSTPFLDSGDKWQFVNNAMPFIFGSAGTVAFDMVYFYQYYVLYADDGKLRLLERELMSSGRANSTITNSGGGGSSNNNDTTGQDTSQYDSIDRNIVPSHRVVATDSNTTEHTGLLPSSGRVQDSI